MMTKRVVCVSPSLTSPVDRMAITGMTERSMDGVKHLQCTSRNLKKCQISRRLTGADAKVLRLMQRKGQLYRTTSGNNDLKPGSVHLAISRLTAASREKPCRYCLSG